MICKRAALAAVALVTASAPAQSAVTISTAATQNMSCSDGVCEPTAANAVLNVSDLESMLGSGSVLVTTAGNGIQAGDIDVSAPCSWTSSYSLTLNAYKSIGINQAISVMGTGGVSVITDQGGAGGLLTIGSKGNVTFRNVTSTFALNGTTYKLFSTIAGLARDIRLNPAGNFALARNIDAESHGAYAASPITTTFTGTLVGLGNQILKLSITDTKERDSVGLFSEVAKGGSVKFLRLVREAVRGAGPSPTAGGLVAINDGTLLGDSVEGTMVVGVNYRYTAVGTGGLVGINNGAIVRSWVSGKVQGGGDTNIGGLTGLNYGSISNSHTANDVVGEQAANVGGLVGYNNGKISYAYSAGSITMPKRSILGNIGGLVGWSDSKSSISYAYSHGKVSAYSPLVSLYTGGLVGYSSSGTISNSYADGNVSGSYKTGGLVGWDQSTTISDSYASGTVIGYGASGGLVGYNTAGSITACHATGDVTAGAWVGGLVGNNEQATLDNTYATGKVTGNATGVYAGGLVGANAGTIKNSHALGEVDASGQVGGLVGENAAVFDGENSYVENSYAKGKVVASGSEVGGLVGINIGEIKHSHATGSVTSTGGGNIGGLVGFTDEGVPASTIVDSYATGNVACQQCGAGAEDDVGGLVGRTDEGSISGSFATGEVSGGDPSSVGGLVGYMLNGASTVNSYSTGSVTGGSGSNAGGLVGYTTGSTNTGSYSTGAVTAGANSYVGGLVGDDASQSGDLDDTYWDTDLSGITNLSQGAGNIANDPGIAGLTTAQLQSGLPAGFSLAVWGEESNINNGLPYLIKNPPPK